MEKQGETKPRPQYGLNNTEWFNTRITGILTGRAREWGRQNI